MPRRLRTILTSMSGMVRGVSLIVPEIVMSGSCARSFFCEPPCLVDPTQLPVPDCKAQPTVSGVFRGLFQRPFQSCHTFLDPTGHQQGGAQTASDLANHRVQRIDPDRPVKMVDRRGLVTDIKVHPTRGIEDMTGIRIQRIGLQQDVHPAPLLLPKKCNRNAREGQGHCVVAVVDHHLLGQRQAACGCLDA